MPNSPKVSVYGSSPVREFLAATTLRYVADGIPLQEVRRAQRRIATWDQWWDYWVDRASVLSALAATSPTRETRHTLGVVASLCAHLAQYLHFHDLEAKHAALRMKIELYRSALEPAPHASHLLEAPYRTTSVPALLHVPVGTTTAPPCVVFVGGLDAHKEDAHDFVKLCLSRGLAVAALDGPGQGESMLRGLMFEADAHESVSSLIDLLETRDDVDGRRVGIIGRSLGGYLAPRAAADDSRIRALAVWGAMWDLSVLGRFPAHTRAGFAYITGSRDLSESMDRLRFVNLEGHAGRINAPALIVHGQHDRLTPESHARHMASMIGSSAELRIIPGSEHCNHDEAHLVRPSMADWLAESLAN